MSEPRVTNNVFDGVPSPSEIRERIARHIEEGKILRRLLRVAEETVLLSQSPAIQQEADSHEA
jgi:hypothetical protein